MQDNKTLKKQYKTGRNLETRVSLHDKYSVNKQGFGNWIFENYKFFNGCKILELGCGTGGMFIAKNWGTSGTRKANLFFQIPFSILYNTDYRVGSRVIDGWVVLVDKLYISWPFNEKKYSITVELLEVKKSMHKGDKVMTLKRDFAILKFDPALKAKIEPSDASIVNLAKS